MRSIDPENVRSRSGLVGVGTRGARGIGMREAIEAERELLDLVLGDGDSQRALESDLVPTLGVCGAGERIAPQYAVRAQRVNESPGLGV